MSRAAVPYAWLRIGSPRTQAARIGRGPRALASVSRNRSRQLLDWVADAPELIPGLLAVGVIAVWSLAQAGAFPTSSNPGGLFILGLLVAVTIAFRRSLPALPRPDAARDRVRRRLHRLELCLDRLGRRQGGRLGWRQPRPGLLHRVRPLRAAALAAAGGGHGARRLLAGDRRHRRGDVPAGQRIRSPGALLHRRQLCRADGLPQRRCRPVPARLLPGPVPGLAPRDAMAAPRPDAGGGRPAFGAGAAAPESRGADRVPDRGGALSGARPGPREDADRGGSAGGCDGPDRGPDPRCLLGGQRRRSGGGA